MGSNGFNLHGMWRHLLWSVAWSRLGNEDGAPVSDKWNRISEWNVNESYSLSNNVDINASTSRCIVCVRVSQSTCFVSDKPRSSQFEWKWYPVSWLESLVNELNRARSQGALVLKRTVSGILGNLSKSTLLSGHHVHDAILREELDIGWGTERVDSISVEVSYIKHATIGRR